MKVEPVLPGFIADRQSKGLLCAMQALTLDLDTALNRPLPADQTEND